MAYTKLSPIYDPRMFNSFKHTQSHSTNACEGAEMPVGGRFKRHWTDYHQGVQPIGKRFTSWAEKI